MRIAKIIILRFILICGGALMVWACQGEQPLGVLSGGLAVIFGALAPNEEF